MLGGVSAQLKFLWLFGAGARDQGSMEAIRAGLFSAAVRVLAVGTIHL